MYFFKYLGCFLLLQKVAVTNNVIIQKTEKTLNSNQTTKQKLTNLVSATPRNTSEIKTLLSKTFS